MLDARADVPLPANEPVQDHAPGSPERAALKAALRDLRSRTAEIPLLLGGTAVTTGDLGRTVMPHDHAHVLATFHNGQAESVERAIRAAADARAGWAATPWEDRAAIFLRAAALLAGRYRPLLNAATMLNQSKTAHQAEIDAACELIDFWRFNVAYMHAIYGQQPRSIAGAWNQMEYRPLEGFVLAITPFNFTSIAGNLPTSPALMGNTVVWKPASTALYPAYLLMQLLQEAGLPDGVINMVPGPGREIGLAALRHPELGGVHFTGSTAVFQHMWRTVGERIETYRSYPRLVGETGGKDFIVAHASAQPDELITALVRGAFEYQGQKCSAVSRAYIPDTLWSACRDRLLDEVRTITYGDPSDFSHFMGAVIDRDAYARITNAIEQARHHPDADVICGGESNDETGYFIAPTIIQAHTPRYTTMEVELFGPVLTVYVYKASEYEDTLGLCDTTSPYALTGAIFATDRRAIRVARDRLRHAAGNFYINDKPTGAVVSQQPFGGARASGTNDKAGSALNLLRWTSVRTIKETFAPPRTYRYPYMEEP